jgi:hypothetical protein
MKNLNDSHPLYVYLSNLLPNDILCCIGEFADRFCGVCQDFYPSQTECTCTEQIEFKTSSSHIYSSMVIKHFSDMHFCDEQTQTVWDYWHRKFQNTELRFEFPFLAKKECIGCKFGGTYPFVIKLIKCGNGRIVIWDWVLQDSM